MIELTDGFDHRAARGDRHAGCRFSTRFSYPERWSRPITALDLTRAGRLEFEAPDTEAVPLPAARLPGARRRAQPPVVLNAANEIAVGAVSGRPARFLRYRPRHRGDDGCPTAGRGSARWPKCAHVDHWARGTRHGTSPRVRIKGHEVFSGDTILAFVFVIGVLVYRSRARAFFSPTKRVGIRSAQVPVGVQPDHRELPAAADTEYWHRPRCRSVGYVEDGGRRTPTKSSDDERGERDSSIRTNFSRNQVGAVVQVLIMGPIMNLPPRRGPHRAGAVSGFVERLVVSRDPTGRGRTRYRRIGGGEGLINPDRCDLASCPVAGRTVDTWDQFDQSIGMKPNIEVSIGLLRNGLEQTLKLTPTVAGQSTVRWSGVSRRGCRTCTRTSARYRRTVRPNEPVLKTDDAVLAVDGQPIKFFLPV